MAHKFLSIIVTQVCQLLLRLISQSVLLQNIHQDSILIQYSLVQDGVGTIGEFLKQRTESPLERWLAV